MLLTGRMLPTVRTLRTGAQRVTTATRALTRWTRRSARRAPLRVKLVAALLLLVTAALAGSGAVAAATLSTYLVGKVDGQLRSIEGPIAAHPNGAANARTDAAAAAGAGDGDGDNKGRAVPPSAYVVEWTDAQGAPQSSPTSTYLRPGQRLPALPRFTAAQSKAAGSHIFNTYAVGGGDEQWRVIAAPVTLTDGSPGTVLVAQSLHDVQNTVRRLELSFLLIGAAALLILAGIGYVVVRVSLRPLRQVELTAAKIADGDLSRRVPDADPRTEVGQLSSALNRMLAEIEAAFAARAASEEAARRSEEAMRRSEAAARGSEQRMRRFVADASHELRTPLTSIRGFAELFGQGAVTEGEDLRRLMSRIEDEAKRMGLLVEDLLLLARLDQERPLSQTPVDLLALAGDAVHDAQALAPDRPVHLEVGSTDPPPVVIGDEARLRQVLTNLVGNALKHTPAGTPVSVLVSTGIDERSAEPAVLLAVVDEGPGMSEEQAARVFERFYRADSARSHSTGSTGLGLAIVAALVAGHGGTVAVHTSPGAGARFQLVLPLAALPAGAAASSA